MKYLISIPTGGTVCFILKGWGGRIINLTKKSGFLRYLTYGDKMIVDRGFSIAKTAGTYGTRLEIPPFTKSSLEQRKLKI